MKKCSACQRKARKLQHAMVLEGPGKMRRGLVCQSCAATGWLLVFGGEREQSADREVHRVAAKAFSALDATERRTLLSLKDS